MSQHISSLAGVGKKFLLGIFALSIIASGFSAFALKVQAQESMPTGTQQSSNPVIWKTNYANFSSSNFRIDVNGQTFTGSEGVSVHSSPGTDRTTLEMQWVEKGIPMRMYLYFQMKSDQTWELYEARTYNGRANGDWVYYQVKGAPVTAVKGAAFTSPALRLSATDGSNARIYCETCRIQAFPDPVVKYSSHGYGIELMIGEPENEVITVLASGNMGYGVNALLRNSKNEVVTNQTGITYEWVPADPQIVQIYTDTIDYGNGMCAYGIKPPCPAMNGQIAGKNPGVTRVQVLAKKDGYTIALAEFDVRVLPYKPEPQATGSPSSASSPRPTATIPPTPSPSPRPKPSTSPWPMPVDDGSLSNEELQREFEKLQTTVGEVQLDVARQQQELNALQKLVQSINSFFQRIFGRAR